MEETGRDGTPPERSRPVALFRAAFRMRSRWPTLLALVAVLVPLALASGASPPPDAATVLVADRTVAHWVGNESAVVDRMEPGAAGALHVAVNVDRKETNASQLVFYVNVSSANLTFAESSAVLTKSFGNNTTSEAYHVATFNFTAPAEAGNASYTFTVDAQAVDADGNVTLLGTGGGQGTFSVGVAPAPPPTGIPTSWLVGGAAVVLVAVGAGALAARSRSQRRKMRGQTRSQALREVELEERMEKRPEEAAAIQQEIRQQEKVKEKRRDLQILEAKRADVLKTMDLLKKRHESGGLTKLQYDNMVAKKQADLQRIETDIAAMEAEDAGGSGAAA